MLRGSAANEVCLCLEVPLLRVGSGPVLDCSSHERMARSCKMQTRYLQLQRAPFCWAAQLAVLSACIQIWCCRGSMSACTVTTHFHGLLRRCSGADSSKRTARHRLAVSELELQVSVSMHAGAYMLEQPHEADQCNMLVGTQCFMLTDAQYCPLR